MINYMTVPIKSEKNTIRLHADAVNAMISYAQDKPVRFAREGEQEAVFQACIKTTHLCYDT